MNAQNTKLPTLTLEQSEFLMWKVAELGRTIDVYEMLLEKIPQIRGSEIEPFMAFIQQALWPKIYVGFMAVISSDQLVRLLKSHVGFQPL
jgi:hypothetical protein